MKRFITLYTFLLVCLVIQAQGLKLTIENRAGGLKNAMTTEEIKTVTNLTLTGSMDDSDFYLIRDSMRRLDYLDLKYVNVDTIPARAMDRPNVPELILPVNVKFLGDTAFYSYDNKIYFTGEFPKLGKGVFIDTRGYRVFVSEDNFHCKKNGEGIYSIDGKILYLFRGGSPIEKIAEGTEIIESHALDEAGFYEITLPSSLKLIKQNAFSNFHFNGLADKWHDEVAWFISEASIPPILEKDALDAKSLSQFVLNVPVGTKEIYRQADSQWSVFKDITDYASGVESVKNQPLSVESNNVGEIIVKSEREIASVEIISLSGSLLWKQTAGNSQSISVSNCPNQNFIIRTVFQDGSQYSLKYIR